MSDLQNVVPKEKKEKPIYLSRALDLPDAILKKPDPELALG